MEQGYLDPIKVGEAIAYFRKTKKNIARNFKWSCGYRQNSSKCN